jgi:hypothetical protein
MLTHSMIPVHQIILIIILLCGCYNVLRPILASLDCTPERSFKRSNRRNGRFPLRPWTDEQWANASQNGNFRQNQAALNKIRQAERLLAREARGDIALTAQEVAEIEMAEAAQDRLDKLVWVEKLQALIGDHAFEMRDKKDLRALKADWDTYKRGQLNNGRKNMKEDKPHEEKMRERGRFGRG